MTCIIDKKYIYVYVLKYLYYRRKHPKKLRKNIGLLLNVKAMALQFFLYSP